MENKKEDNQNTPEKTAGEKFWEDLMKMPYNNDKVGQSFVRITWKRLPGTEKQAESKK